MTRHAAVEALLRRMGSERDASLYEGDVGAIRAALFAAVRAGYYHCLREPPTGTKAVDFERVVRSLLGEEPR